MYPGGEEYEEEEEDYQYHNWGVDRVDLDFKSGHHILHYSPSYLTTFRVFNMTVMAFK